MKIAKIEKWDVNLADLGECGILEDIFGNGCDVESDIENGCIYVIYPDFRAESDFAKLTDLNLNVELVSQTPKGAKLADAEKRAADYNKWWLDSIGRENRVRTQVQSIANLMNTIYPKD